jgi:hypothetical protein
MATGELAHQDHGDPSTDGHGGQPHGRDDQPLPRGAFRTPSGRVSAARDVGAEAGPGAPFSSAQLTRLDEALTLASRHTRLRFSVYLGDLGEDSRAGADKLMDQLGEQAVDSVLVAVDPQHRTVDIITGPEAHVRLADRGCKLAVMSMLASFKEGDLFGGLLSGVRMLSDQAGRP